MATKTLLFYMADLPLAYLRCRIGVVLDNGDTYSKQADVTDAECLDLAERLTRKLERLVL